jgi:NAD(P)H-dependent flavin oxidoreductase YrpB (nitropropane dioxygenase family)
MIKTEWTEAWSAPDAPDPLPMPLQYMVSGDCVARSHRYADKALSVMFNPVGQVVGQLNKVERTAAVIQRLVEEYLESVERLNRLNQAAEAEADV